MSSSSTQKDYTIILPNYNKYNDHKCEFIHFSTKEICESFIKKYKYKFNYGHRCCSGKGVKIINEDYDEVKEVVKSFKDRKDEI